MNVSRKIKPLSPRHFAKRMLKHIGASIAIVAVSLIPGMWGYSHYEGLSWRDAFLNAAMLLGGMGPVESPQTNGGKVFAGVYALYAGLVVIIATSVILAPVIHHVIVVFHWDADHS